MPSRGYVCTYCEKRFDSSIYTHDVLNYFFLQKIQCVLGSKYQLKIWSLDRGLAMIFCGPTATETIHIVLAGNDIYFVNSVTAFMERSYFCELCNVPYNNLEYHRCTKTCRYCFADGGNCTKERWTTCYKCRRTFYSRRCYDNHLLIPKGHPNAPSTGVSICEKLSICVNCGRTRERRKQHHCDTFKCPTCKIRSANGTSHECYLTPIDDKHRPDVKGYILFDFEVSQFF